jgi:2-C-methyl-D-erythritol 4-phosphate cytidylyltransferase
VNIAVILAGRCGKEAAAEPPRPFVQVGDKPILIHTLGAFEAHPSIDSIGVVCLEGWQPQLRAYARAFGITKLDWIVTGGATVQESIYRGVRRLEGWCRADDVVVIHDGIRPLVEPAVISNVLATCAQHGNAVAALPYTEQMFCADPGDIGSTVTYIPRDSLRRVSTPQAYRYDILAARYRQAFATGRGLGPGAYANTLMVELGERLHFAAGSDKNIRLTTAADLELFRALLGVRPEYDLPERTRPREPVLA